MSCLMSYAVQRLQSKQQRGQEHENEQ